MDGDQSDGNTQLYETPSTGATLYTWVEPMQGVAFPVMTGDPGTPPEGLTSTVRGIPYPQPFCGVTSIVPASDPTRTVTELEVLPPNVQSAGKLQWYVTPETLVTE
jgi:hypothetical protein